MRAPRVNARGWPAPHSLTQRMSMQCPPELSFRETVVKETGTALGPGELALTEKTGIEEVTYITDATVSLSKPL